MEVDWEVCGGIFVFTWSFLIDRNWWQRMKL